MKSFTGNICTVRRLDGGLATLSISPYPKVLYEYIDKADFEKAYEDSSDYLKFLTTLERSIKDLSSDDLNTIEHSIEGIFHNLKIIYRHL